MRYRLLLLNSVYPIHEEPWIVEIRVVISDRSIERQIIDIEPTNHLSILLF